MEWSLISQALNNYAGLPFCPIKGMDAGTSNGMRIYIFTQSSPSILPFSVLAVIVRDNILNKNYCRTCAGYQITASRFSMTDHLAHRSRHRTVSYLRSNVPDLTEPEN